VTAGVLEEKNCKLDSLKIKGGKEGRRVNELPSLTKEKGKRKLQKGKCRVHWAEKRWDREPGLSVLERSIRKGSNIQELIRGTPPYRTSNCQSTGKY